jgi:cytochrome c biogenesis protein CcmG/thiol:disulfide interchange protein DsbE
VSARSLTVFLGVLAVVGLLAFGLVKKSGASLDLGEKAPVSTLPKLDGHGDASLTSYRGHWVLVNFWASWCLPCRDESPALQSFYRQHRADDFTILGVDTRDLSDDGKGFVDKYGVTYPQLRDGDGDYGHDFGTTGVPENFLVNPQGKLVVIRRGPIDGSYLDRYVAPLLKGTSENG